MSDPQVLVVGGGPAGMVLALLLSRAGVRVRVLEQGVTFAREFRGELLQPGASRILRQLGLRDRILALGYAFPAGIDVDDGRRITSFELPPALDCRSNDGMTIVPQQRLLELLAGEAARSGRCSITMGCSVRGLAYEGRRVTGISVQLHEGERTVLHAPLVIACDGRFSALRRSAGIALCDHPVPFDLVWSSAPLPGDSPDRVSVKLSRNEMVVAFASRSHQMQVGWFVRKGRLAALRARPFAEVADHLAARVPAALAGAVRASLRGWHDLAVLPAVSQVAQRWSQPGLLLLGDAAHPMSPAMGQGINVAIYDAVVAARELAAAFAGAGSIDGAVRAIERQRRPSVVATQRTQNVLTGIMYVLGPAAAFRLARVALRTGTQTRWWPRCIKAEADRLLWGAPNQRASYGLTAMPAAFPPNRTETAGLAPASTGNR